MKCVILQPSYIPWRGYFHQIFKADVFVFYDDVQYDKRGWRNRNRIKTPQGTKWLTIPVHSRGAQIEHTPIHAIKIDWEQPWNTQHLKALQHSYAKAPYYNQYRQALEQYYQQKFEYLADFDICLTTTLAGWLGIRHTQFIRSSELHTSGNKTDKLIQILRKLGADHYISGPAAKAYIEEEKFKEAGIRLEYMTYQYPPYPQLYPPYDPQVSILDLLFMTGDKALQYIIQPEA
ncbi:MAG: WbqC family protein [Anaerolineae bacterium]|nr:WbqC family protein [Anaerolineae bacterium]